MTTKITLVPRAIILLLAILSAAAGVLSSSRLARAQEETGECPSVTQTMSDAELYQSAACEYKQQHWVRAAMLLEAYWERNPERPKSDAAYRTSVAHALQYAESAAKAYYVWSSVSGNPALPIRSTPEPPPALDMSEAPQPPSYPLLCRGGSLSVEYRSSSPFSGSPQFRIAFAKAPQAAGLRQEHASHLLPGQCAWLDRPVGTGEPNHILVLDRTAAHLNIIVAWQRGEVTRAMFDAPYLAALTNPNALQTFQVFNDGRGNFVVTGISKSTKLP